MDTILVFDVPGSDKLFCDPGILHNTYFLSIITPQVETAKDDTHKHCETVIHRISGEEV